MLKVMSLLWPADRRNSEKEALRGVNASSRVFSGDSSKAIPAATAVGPADVNTTAERPHPVDLCTFSAPAETRPTNSHQDSTSGERTSSATHRRATSGKRMSSVLFWSSLPEARSKASREALAVLVCDVGCIASARDASRVGCHALWRDLLTYRQRASADE